MSVPYFSVITPSFNQGAFIGACLRSVAAQEDDGYEHLVLDNCSTDQTASEVARFPGVDFRSEPDRGQSDALNKGFAAARGEIICWLNSDDEYPPGVFARLRQAFADREVMVVYGDALQVPYDGGKEELAPGHFASRLDLVRWWSPQVKLHQPAVFFRRRALEDVGPLREDLHFALDYELWWRLSERYDFHYLPAVLAIQHRQPDSKTIRDWARVLQERETIFSPYYALIDGGNRAALMEEKSRELAENYLHQAYALASTRRRTALRLAVEALRIRPRGFWEWRWAGLFKAMWT